MSTSKRILIVVADPSFNWANPNSAVVNYLETIGGFLKSRGFEVDYFPGKHKGGQVSVARKKPSVFKNIIKSTSIFLYNSIRFQKYLKDQRSLISGFSADSYDCCIELLTFGSDFSVCHAESFKRRIVIFDSPLEEQFVDLYGSSVLQMKLLRRREEESLERADVVVCYSPAVEDYLKRSFELKNVVPVPCLVWKKEGVEKRRSDVFTIGFIGSFLKWHKVLRLVKAFEKIASEFNDLELLLIGKGEEWEKVNVYVRNSPFGEKIKMTGFVSEGELEILKSTIDVGVMPGSNWYGSPLKLFEYMESGIPIIGPDTPTVRTLFSDTDLLFVPNTDDPFPLSQAIKQLYESVDLRTRLSNQGRNLMATKFAQEAIMGKFEELINQD